MKVPFEIANLEEYRGELNSEQIYSLVSNMQEGTYFLCVSDHVTQGGSTDKKLLLIVKQKDGFFRGPIEIEEKESELTLYNRETSIYIAIAELFENEIKNNLSTNIKNLTTLKRSKELNQSEKVTKTVEALEEIRKVPGFWRFSSKLESAEKNMLRKKIVAMMETKPIGTYIFYESLSNGLVDKFAITYCVKIGDKKRDIKREPIYIEHTEDGIKYNGLHSFSEAVKATYNKIEESKPDRNELLPCLQLSTPIFITQRKDYCLEGRKKAFEIANKVEFEGHYLLYESENRNENTDNKIYLTFLTKKRGKIIKEAIVIEKVGAGYKFDGKNTLKEALQSKIDGYSVKAWNYQELQSGYNENNVNTFFSAVSPEVSPIQPTNKRKEAFEPELESKRVQHYKQNSPA